MRHLDAAEPHVVAGAERVHVEALAGPDIAEPRQQQALGAREILGRGHLEIGLTARDQANRETAALGDRGGVRQIQALCTAMRLEDLAKPKRLRCLRAPELAPADGPDAVAAAPRLERLGARTRG